MANNGESKNRKRGWQFKNKMYYAYIIKGKRSNPYRKSHVKNPGCVNRQQGVTGSQSNIGTFRIMVPGCFGPLIIKEHNTATKVATAYLHLDYYLLGLVWGNFMAILTSGQLVSS